MTAVQPFPPARRAGRLYLFAQFIGWTLYGLLNAFFFSGFALPTLRILSGNLAVAGVGFGLSHLLRRAARPSLENDPPSRAWMIRLAWGIPACAIALGLFTEFVQRLLHPIGHALPVGRQAVIASINYLFVFGLWSACYVGVKFMARWRRSELSRLRALAAARQAELARLRAQFEPHFLFNTLNTISALTAEDPELAREAIRHLSALLRASLTLDANALVPLSAEWALVSDYLRLEELRFPQRLKIHHDLSPDALACRLPAFALQTLVENAIKHGSPQAGRLREIKLSASVEADRLCIDVTHCGQLSADETRPVGVGLKNLRDRLTLLCGPRASCVLEQRSPGQVLGRLQIPQR